jgi:DNA-directed RNA polymerase specialized sigma subunit
VADRPIDVIDEFLGLTKNAAAPFQPFSSAFPPAFSGLLGAAAKPKKTKEEFKSQQKQELDMWHHWNDNGRKPEHLKPLLDAYKPMIQSKSQVYTKSQVEVPTSAIEAEFKKHFVNAVKTYDPNKGTQLNTWVDWHMRKGGRYVKTYQNLGKIPERQISNIRKFDAAKMELTAKHGFEPDTHMMAEHLGWPTRRVVQMNKERRKDLPVSGFMQDPTEVLNPKELEAIHTLQYDSRLSQEDRAVYEYTFGMNGKPVLKPGEISKRTSLHPSKVSRIRNKLKGYTTEIMETL